MIQLEDAIIRDIAHHKVSATEGNSIVSDKLFECSSDDEENILSKIFLKPFLNQAQTFEFTHEVSLNYNVLFNVSKDVLAGENFLFESQKLTKHLISVSQNQNIKDGDLFAVKFDNIQFDKTYVQGLGIYKYEEKESFLETSFQGDYIETIFRKGIGSKKPDKACLILFTEEPYTILIVDRLSKETDYWQNEFIQHKPKDDNVNSTNNFLSLTKNYITKQITDEFEVSKADQIDMLNKSVEYFKENETFQKKEFEDAVFEDNGIIDSFREFNQEYSQQHDLDIAEEFEISNQAVKKQARAFKSVLKLDKNFHIYIHGDKDLIEKGTENDGRKFYKIYYEDEN